jgi:transposase
VREIANSLHVGKSSVHSLRRKHFPDAKLSIGGRPRKLTSAMERSCVTSVTRGKVSTTREATKQVQEVFGVQVSEVIVRRALCRAGLQSHVKEKKPHLSSNNIKALLEFAIKYQHSTIDDWSDVIFSYETKINRFSSFGRVWCWVRDPQELSERIVIPTVKHGDNYVIIWGCMCIHRPGMMYRIEGRLN